MSNKLKRKSPPGNNKIKDSSIKLSQCMIVKNEEKNIKKALSWAKDIAFEQIVVDTGSTDRTVEIAEEMGAKVYHFKWIDDFSVAKNYAIEQASGDWIAFLDADEYINETETQYLSNLLNALKQPDNNNQYANIIRVPIININDDGKIITSHLQYRIFRNKQGIKFEGKIHENIICENTEDNTVFHADDIRIWHTGYKDSVIKEKGIRNIPILEKIVETNPDDYDALTYLADSVSSAGDEVKAIELYKQCLDNIESIQSSTRKYHSFLEIIRLSISQNYLADTIYEFFNKFKEYYPLSPDPYYLIAYYEFKIQNFEKAIIFFEQALESLDNYKNDYDPISLYSRADVLNGYSGHSYFNLKDYEKALPGYILYLKVNKDDSNILINTLYIIMQQKNLSQTELDTYILQLLSALYDLTDLRDVLICIKATISLGLTNITEDLKKNLKPTDRNWLENH